MDTFLPTPISPEPIPNTTFHPYLQFPFEIRLQTGRFAIEPRIIHMIAVNSTNVWSFTESSGPNLLSICRESRAEISKIYSLIPQTDGTSPRASLQTWTVPRYQWLVGNRDLVYLHLGLKRPMASSGRYFPLSTALSNISPGNPWWSLSRIAIDSSVMTGVMQDPEEAGSLFWDLKKLTLCSSSEWGVERLENDVAAFFAMLREEKKDWEPPIVTIENLMSKGHRYDTRIEELCCYRREDVLHRKDLEALMRAHVAALGLASGN